MGVAEEVREEIERILRWLVELAEKAEKGEKAKEQAIREFLKNVSGVARYQLFLFKERKWWTAYCKYLIKTTEISPMWISPDSICAVYAPCITYEISLKDVFLSSESIKVEQFIASVEDYLQTIPDLQMPAKEE